VLGGGSNVIVADMGHPGLVIRVALEGLSTTGVGEDVLLTAAAGETWDEVVHHAVDAGLAGVECLSGIPGTAGATPIQNVGAYGQEVAEVVEEVRVLDRPTLAEARLSRSDCAFGYRSSCFREDPGRFIVLEVVLRLRAGGEPALRYDELRRAVAARGTLPTVGVVRETVLELRRGKSMVLDDDDPNRRSVGSFFVNPVLAEEDAGRVIDSAHRCGLVPSPDRVPRFPAGQDRVKLPAAWLIERAGFARGYRSGRVGVSTRHALALVHHGGGTTAELIAMARDIRSAVHDLFGVLLRPEPVFLGFADEDPLGPPPEER
jgi:UDP-N-acetylmuramate dehydrogenase